MVPFSCQVANRARFQGQLNKRQNLLVLVIIVNLQSRLNVNTVEPFKSISTAVGPTTQDKLGSNESIVMKRS